MTILELRHGQLDLAQRSIDRAAHAQGQQSGQAEAGGNQQQAGKQAAVTSQQHAAVGQLQLDPAQQAVGFFGDQFAGEVAMLAEYRQQVARGIVAGALQQLGTVALRCTVEHGRAGMGQWRAVGGEEGHGAHVRLFKGLGGDALQQIAVLATHGRGDQRCKLFGDHLATLQQLGMQVRLLHPGEIAAQDQRHQAGRQQGQQQHAAFDPQFLQHICLLHPAVRSTSRASGTQYLRSVAICRRAISVKFMSPCILLPAAVIAMRGGCLSIGDLE